MRQRLAVSRFGYHALRGGSPHAAFSQGGRAVPARRLHVPGAGHAGRGSLDLRKQLEAYEATQGGKLQAAQRSRAFLLFKWLDDLIRDPRVLDPIEQLIGPDILCWSTIFWIKDAGSKSFVSWHQDNTYWGLSSRSVVTAWFAISDASVAAGCMSVLPGSHLGRALEHEDTYHEDNMLSAASRSRRSTNRAR